MGRERRVVSRAKQNVPCNEVKRRLEFRFDAVHYLRAFARLVGKRGNSLFSSSERLTLSRTEGERQFEKEVMNCTVGRGLRTSSTTSSCVVANAQKFGARAGRKLRLRNNNINNAVLLSSSSSSSLLVNDGASARRRSGFVCRGAVVDSLDTDISEGIKASLIELIEEGNDEYRMQINEMLYQLESRNLTMYPTTSPLLNGVWEFKYLPGIAPGFVPSPTREIALFMYAGGYTPGKFLFDVSQRLPSSLLEILETKITISPSQPRGKITASVKVFNNSFPVELRTSLDAESDVRMREIYLDAEAVGRDVTIPANLRTERVFYITYLDEDLLISRDESGTPDVLYRAAGASQAAEEEEKGEEEVVASVEPDAAIEPEDEDEEGEDSGKDDDGEKTGAEYSW